VRYFNQLDTLDRQNYMYFTAAHCQQQTKNTAGRVQSPRKTGAMSTKDSSTSRDDAYNEIQLIIIIIIIIDDNDDDSSSLGNF